MHPGSEELAQRGRSQRRSALPRDMGNVLFDADLFHASKNSSCVRTRSSMPIGSIERLNVATVDRNRLSGDVARRLAAEERDERRKLARGPRPTHRNVARASARSASSSLLYNCRSRSVRIRPVAIQLMVTPSDATSPESVFSADY